MNGLQKTEGPKVIVSGSKTLGETIWDLVNSKKTDSPEFQNIINYFGREKVKELYLAERQKRQDVKNA